MLFHYDMISVPLVYTQVRLLPLQAWISDFMNITLKNEIWVHS